MIQRGFDRLADAANESLWAIGCEYIEAAARINDLYTDSAMKLSPNLTSTLKNTQDYLSHQTAYSASM